MWSVWAGQRHPEGHPAADWRCPATDTHQQETVVTISLMPDIQFIVLAYWDTTWRHCAIYSLTASSTWFSSCSVSVLYRHGNQPLSLASCTMHSKRYCHLEGTHRVRTHAVLLLPILILTITCAHETQNHVISRISQGHTLYQVWTLWASFVIELCSGHTDI